jgi:hypothetical protein
VALGCDPSHRPTLLGSALPALYAGFGATDFD